MCGSLVLIFIWSDICNQAFWFGHKVIQLFFVFFFCSMIVKKKKEKNVLMHSKTLHSLGAKVAKNSNPCSLLSFPGNSPLPAPSDRQYLCSSALTLTARLFFGSHARHPSNSSALTLSRTSCSCYTCSYHLQGICLLCSLLLLFGLPASLDPATD